MRRIQQSSNLSQTQIKAQYYDNQLCTLDITRQYYWSYALNKMIKAWSEESLIAINSWSLSVWIYFLHLRTLNLRNTGTPIDKILRIKLPVDRRDLCRSTACTSSTGHKMSSTINPGLKSSSSFVHASYRRCNQPATNALGSRNNSTRDSPHRIPSAQQVPF
jgi:hypothetical protein